MSEFVPGHVEQGGATAAWTIGALEIRKASVSDMDNNAYLLTHNGTGERLLIDAADDPARLADLLAEPERDGDLIGILTTHRHADHHGALAALVDRTGAPTYAGQDDADALPVAVDHRLQHGDQITLGDQRVQVIALRGHTPGSVALAWTDADNRTYLFTGDSLFPGGVGKTSSAEDFRSLIDDVTERIFAVYDDDTVVFPGHGDNTTLGAERGDLEEWRARGW